jgi:hypothetical protein
MGLHGIRAPICLAMAALCCRSAPPDKGDQPPVVTRKVDAEYPPEMAKSYLLENVAVHMGIGPDGAPFDLNAVAPLPDNVVRALAQWRFQPGTRGGQPVAYSIGLNVRVHRPITRAVESSLRRRWPAMDKEVKDAMQAGKALDAAGAAQLERGLAGNPASLRDRIALLAYFASEPAAANSDETRKARADQIAWLVENSPDAAVLDSPLALINAAAGPLADQAGYERVRDLWLPHVSWDPDKPGILSHGTNFLRVADPEKTEELLVAAAAKSKDAAIWLGDLYGLAALGVTGLDLNTGLPVSAGARIPDTPMARKARAALRTTGDARVLLSGLAVVSTGGRSLAKAGHLPEDYRVLCRELLDHATQIYPASSASCETSAPETENREPLRITVGSNVQQAKLLSQPPPKYPPEARRRRIQGTLEFQATIGKQGGIGELEFLRGPLIFYETSRESLLRWKYRPTLLNGEPVDVLTRIDVSYTLSR